MKLFVSELVKLYMASTTRSVLESVALKAVTVLPILLFQKTACGSKAKAHIGCIEWCLPLWHNGQLDDRLKEHLYKIGSQFYHITARLKNMTKF